VLSQPHEQLLTKPSGIIGQHTHAQRRLVHYADRCSPSDAQTARSDLSARLTPYSHIRKYKRPFCRHQRDPEAGSSPRAASNMVLQHGDADSREHRASRVPVRTSTRVSKIAVAPQPIKHCALAESFSLSSTISVVPRSELLDRGTRAKCPFCTHVLVQQQRQYPDPYNVTASPPWKYVGQNCTCLTLLQGCMQFLLTGHRVRRVETTKTMPVVRTACGLLL